MTLSECIALLRENDNYLILTHARPDGDTLCSAAALCSALRREGKTAAMYKNPEITDSYEDIVALFLAEHVPEEPYVLSVDMADTTMLPGGFEGHVRLSIDHHGSNSGYADKTLVMSHMASCGEIIMLVIEELCKGITADEANLLYVAVSTDTGCFCYGNTTSETLRNAAHIVDCGAENGKLNKRFFRSYSYSRLMLEGLIYSGLRSYRGNTINIAIITLDMMQKSGATEDDCDDLASLAGKVKGNVVAITIRELSHGMSKASVRTNELVNAAAVCARFGGGGHAMAAGCTVEAGPQELADMVLQAVNDIWK